MAELGDTKSRINLRNIKSSYITKKIFSFLNEKQLLKMIIYRKELQKMLLIDIEDYKKISNIYKIVEKNGNGKEFKISSNILIFEGEYSKGIRNGKGKEYYLNGQLEFEGEYLNGERNGKGKEYNDKGNLEFEGEYLNGKKWNGKGKEYNYNDQLEFEIKKGKENIKNLIDNNHFIQSSNPKTKIIKKEEKISKEINKYLKYSKLQKSNILNNQSFKNTITKKFSNQIEKVFSFNIIKKEKYLLLNNEISFTILCKPKKNYQKELANIVEILKKESKFYKEKDFREQKLIYEGGFSKIYTSFNIKDNQEVCLKKINIENMVYDYKQRRFPEDSYERDLKNEIELLKLFSDKKNSVKYYGDYDKIVEKTIILEKCEYDLEDFLKKRGAFSTDEIKKIFRDINEIFKIMQQKKIIHRDLKLKNFLVKYLDEEKSKYIVKLSDYGIGKFLNKANIFSGYKGTDEYMAPEMALEKTKEYKNNYDIFSLGIILYQLAHNPLNNNLRHPFKITNDQSLQVIYWNLYDKDNYVIDFDESIKCEEYKDLVKLMLKLNPENRLNWDQYFAHPFFK